MTLRAVAELAGITESYLSRIEHGRRPVDRRSLLEAIAVALPTQSGIVLAIVHVQAGEPGGLSLAHGAITAVSKLSSVRARHRLEPLTAALEARHRHQRPRPNPPAGHHSMGVTGSAAGHRPLHQLGEYDGR